MILIIFNKLRVYILAEVVLIHYDRPGLRMQSHTAPIKPCELGNYVRRYVVTYVILLQAGIQFCTVCFHTPLIRFKSNSHVCDTSCFVYYPKWQLKSEHCLSDVPSSSQELHRGERTSDLFLKLAIKVIHKVINTTKRILHLFFPGQCIHYKIHAWPNISL
jgi:hypothetical protein